MAKVNSFLIIGGIVLIIMIAMNFDIGTEATVQCTNPAGWVGTEGDYVCSSDIVYQCMSNSRWTLRFSCSGDFGEGLYCSEEGVVVSEDPGQLCGLRTCSYNDIKPCDSCQEYNQVCSENKIGASTPCDDSIYNSCRNDMLDLNFGLSRTCSCSEPGPQCTDTDGGINKEQKGTVTEITSFGGTRTGTDVCVPAVGDRTALKEYFCENNLLKIDIMECSDCVNGAGECPDSMGDIGGDDDTGNGGDDELFCGDGVCEDSETIDNCPNDCLETGCNFWEKEDDNGDCVFNTTFALIAGGALLLILLITAGGKKKK